MPGSSATASSAPASAAETELEPRTLGKYQLLRLLARGGMGEVHLARLPGELGFEKRLVVKTIRADLAADPRFVELFAAEAKTAVALSHPNIAPIYELGRADDGTLYTAMGWVDGPSLHVLGSRLRELDRTLELGAALFITREVLDGLAHAHSRDRERPPVVHRDITPGNVLVDRSGRVQIVDFGIAKPAEAEVAGIMGSVGYMAPEQARGGVVDPRADVFSVGCLLYELLTNHRAFEREGVWMLPSFAGVPEPLHAVLERALALEPGRRYADAEAFLRVIAQIMAEHAPAFGTRDLAAILAELFEGDWAARSDERAGERTPATLITGAVQTFATRLEPDEGRLDPGKAPPAHGAAAATRENEAPARAPATREGSTATEGSSGILVTAPPRRRTFAWPLALLLAASAGLGGYLLARQGGSEPRSQAPQAARDDDAPPPEPRMDPRREPSEPPEPTRPPTRVELELSPADASVELDGEALDGPPYVLELRGEAPVELAVRHPNHRSRSLTLDPIATAAGPLRIELEALEPGSLTVLAPSVAWAEVWLDGAKLGTTPLTDRPVLEGKHKLEVRCTPAVCGASQVLLEQSVRVRPGRPLKLSAEGS